MLERYGERKVYLRKDMNPFWYSGIEEIQGSHGQERIPELDLPAIHILRIRIE